MIDTEAKVFNAISEAVHAAIKSVGGIDGVRAMSLFPSSKKASENKKKAA